MRLKLSVLYVILILMVCLSGYFLFFPISEPAAPVEEEPEEYITIREEIQEGERDGRLDFTSLLGQNEDFTCWLNIPDTTISYPVVLGEDNSFYLKHSFTGQESRFGCPFIDTRTPPEGEVIMIHGHNMGYNREEMFSPLMLMQDRAYAASHNKIHLSFPGEEKEREYRIFSVGNFNVLDESFDFYKSSFSSEEEREEYFSYFAQSTLYCSDTEPPEGRILILSTCNDLYGEDNRLLICAVESSSMN